MRHAFFGVTTAATIGKSRAEPGGLEAAHNVEVQSFTVS
jgi:hypothetical protein